MVSKGDNFSKTVLPSFFVSDIMYGLKLSGDKLYHHGLIATEIILSVCVSFFLILTVFSPLYDISAKGLLSY